MCQIQKQIKGFYNNYTECKECKCKRILKRYHDNEDKMSSQQKIYYEKERDKLLQNQNNRHINFKELFRSFVELQNKLKEMEAKITKND